MRGVREKKFKHMGLHDSATRRTGYHHQGPECIKIVERRIAEGVEYDPYAL